MTDPSDNIVLRRLQEMRTEIAARDEKMQAQIAVLAEGLVPMRRDMEDTRQFL